MKKELIWTVVVVGFLTLASDVPAQKGGKGGNSEFTKAAVETNDTAALYELRGDAFRPGSLMNSTLYEHGTDCVFAGVASNGRLVFFTEHHNDECRMNPVRYLTIEGTGLDLDGDGTAESVETVPADVNMDKLFSSSSTTASFFLLRTTYFPDGSRVVEGGTGWKLNYTNVPVTGSDNVRTATASGVFADASLCEVVQVGKRSVCESRGTVNLPFEFTVTLVP